MSSSPLHVVLVDCLCWRCETVGVIPSAISGVDRLPSIFVSIFTLGKSKNFITSNTVSTRRLVIPTVTRLHLWGCQYATDLCNAHYTRMNPKPQLTWWLVMRAKKGLWTGVAVELAVFRASRFTSFWILGSFLWIAISIYTYSTVADTNLTWNNYFDFSSPSPNLRVTKQDGT